ncbi:hypothetical protein HW537_11285 [Asaia siamensis]
MDDAEEPKVIAFRMRDDSTGNKESVVSPDRTPEELIEVVQQEITRLNDVVSQAAAMIIDGQMAVLKQVIIPLMKHASDEALEEIAQRMCSEELNAAFGDISLRSCRLWYETSRCIIAARHSGDDPQV